LRRNKLPATRSRAWGVWLAASLGVAACAPGPRLIAVVEHDPNSILLFDGALRPIDTLPVSWPPEGAVRVNDVQFSPGGRSLLIAASTPPGIVRIRVDGSFLDGEGLSDRATPSRLQALPNATRWMVTADSPGDTSGGGGGLVLFVSNDSLSEEARLPACRRTPIGPAIHRDGRRAWVRCVDPEQLVEIDVELRRIVRTSPLASEAPGATSGACGGGGIELSRTGGTLLVPCEVTGWLLYIDPRTLHPYDSLWIGEGADLPVVGPRGSQAVITVPSHRSVALADLRRRTVLTRLDVSGVPVAAVFGSDGRRVYVLTSDERSSPNTLLAIDFASGTVVATVPIPGAPVGVSTWPGQRSPVMRWAALDRGHRQAPAHRGTQEESPGP